MKILTALTLLLISLSLFSCIQNGGRDEDSARNFELPVLGGDKEFSLKEFSGKPVILNFWASWCAPCKDELPILEKTFNQYAGENVEFIGINIMDNKDDALSLVETYDLSYLNLYDENGDVSQMYGVTALPVTVFINRNGKIIRKKFGPFVGKEGEAIFKSYIQEMIQ